MSRLPRRPVRVQPPLRGRAAIRHYRSRYAPIALVRPVLKPPSGSMPTHGIPGRERPGSPPHDTEILVPQPVQKSLFNDLFEFYKGWTSLVRRIDQPWQWLLALAIVLMSVLLLPRLL